MPSETTPADLKARMKASYDAIAPKYNEWTTSHADKKLNYLDQLLSHLPTKTTTPVSVLELGCGYGLPVTQRLLSYPHFSVVGNDLSSAQLALARKNLPSEKLTLAEGDMLALDFPPATFDAVVGMYSIIHLPREEQVLMLKKIVLWLKPGGWMLANFGAAETKAIEAQNWLGEEKGWMYWSGWGAEGTLEKIREAGLEIVVKEIKIDEDEVAVKFLWVLAKKSE